MKILVVDDDPLAAEMTSAILEAVGYQPLIAENAVEGMEILGSSGNIALIVSDLNMPLISGVDFFHELREQGNQTPFILLTGDSTDNLAERIPGLAGCLTKDYDLPETLPHVVSQLLQA